MAFSPDCCRGATFLMSAAARPRRLGGIRVFEQHYVFRTVETSDGGVRRSYRPAGPLAVLAKRRFNAAIAFPNFSQFPCCIAFWAF